MSPLNFKIQKKLSEKIPNALGRAGVLATPHGEILTPAFVPVATKATVKSLTPEQVVGTGAQVVLANTYHLYLQPGDEIVRDAGGLAKIMNWRTKSGDYGPTMTDSGGFQAFSLGVAYGNGIGKFIGAEDPGEGIKEAIKDIHKAEKKAKVTEEGIEFISVLDGSKHFMSPEDSMMIQHNIGADIIFALDEFTSPHADYDQIKATIERTERWAKRCLDYHSSKIVPQKPLRSLASGPVGIFSEQFSPSLFGIVQGGRHEDLRKESASSIGALDFDGFGIGGTFVKEDMATAVRWVNEILPEEKPRHLLGVGEPIDLFLGVENGCDTFDCVAPTRMARNGALYTRSGKINVLNAKYKNDFSPFLDNYTYAYIHHLFKAREMLGATLATIHNLSFLNNLMFEIRQSILDGNFAQLKEEFFNIYKS